MEDDREMPEEIRKKYDYYFGQNEDDDGLIDKTGLQRVLCCLYQDPTQKELDAIFTEHDSNDDAKLDKIEFAKWMKGRWRLLEETVQEFETCLHTLCPGDSIHIDELVLKLTKLGEDPLDEEAARELAAEIDKDDSKIITHRELADYLYKRDDQQATEETQGEQQESTGQLAQEEGQEEVAEQTAGQSAEVAQEGVTEQQQDDNQNQEMDENANQNQVSEENPNQEMDDNPNQENNENTNQETDDNPNQETEENPNQETNDKPNQEVADDQQQESTGSNQEQVQPGQTNDSNQEQT